MNKVFDWLIWAVIALVAFEAAVNTVGNQIRMSHGFAQVLWHIAIFVVFVALIARILNFSIFPRIFQAIGDGLMNLFGFFLSAGRKWEGARYMGMFEAWRFFSPSNQGFVIDGKHRRLSPKVSFQSVLTVGGMGKGKSSGFVMPNCYTLDNCSLVITDTSGEIHQQTSGYLASKGFRIEVLNLIDVNRSSGYNPLAGANSYTEIQQIAHLILKSTPAAGAQDDAFWTAGAEKILRILIQCLKNRDNRKHINLANVKYLLNHFDAHIAKPEESRFDRFVLDSTINDQSTWHDYRGFASGNQKTMLSFISTADTALNALGNPDIAKLTAYNQVNFDGLRRRKTAFYVLVRQQDLSYYAFLLNLFYTDLFRSLLSDINHGGLPVYLLLDEFGHLTIPDFATFATTARKYQVAFWIFLQSLSQLESRYGHHEARTILDGLQTEIYLSGMSIEMAEMIARRLGRRRKRTDRSSQHFGEENLMNPDDIISMSDDEALLLYSNKRPFHYRITPFYRQGWMQRASRITEPPWPSFTSKTVDFIQFN